MAESNDLDVMHALAFFYWRRNQNERAAAIAYAAHSLGHHDVKLTCLLALTLLDLNLPDRSLAVLEDVERHDDPEVERSICSIRARALLRLNRVDRAREEFQRGLAAQTPPEKEAV